MRGGSFLSLIGASRKREASSKPCLRIRRVRRTDNGVCVQNQCQRHYTTTVSSVDEQRSLHQSTSIIITLSLLLLMIIVTLAMIVITIIMTISIVFLGPSFLFCSFGTCFYQGVWQGCARIRGGRFHASPKPGVCITCSIVSIAVFRCMPQAFLHPES